MHLEKALPNSQISPYASRESPAEIPTFSSCAFKESSAKFLKISPFASSHLSGILKACRPQATCGLELAKLLIESYELDNVPADDEAVGRILRILEVLKSAHASPSQPSTSGPQGTAAVSGPLDAAAFQITAAAIKWARKAPPGGSSTGAGGGSGTGAGAADPSSTTSNEGLARLHRAAAQWLTIRNGPEGLASAVPHFFKANDMEGLAEAVRAAAAEAPAEERDLFCLRAALQVMPLLLDCRYPLREPLERPFEKSF
jgi:Golgi to ER traffic protein 4